ncbi:heavy-metal-associated domain-containing protein [Halegenticoccus soli]|uniref:heavy-metal-associated domain-containing protein n=1 Tax=Halegenticoccus soli TaxID=1985678 RepID=UPI000C6D80CF|nr:heavy-metal-associated domain-containing protein [Halegenticoccus soli]
MHRTRLRVSGMESENAARLVENELLGIEGVDEVRTDRSTGTVVVDHDADEAPTGDLHDAVRNAGYEVSGS